MNSGLRTFHGVHSPIRAMEILLYGINFAPELTGIGKYTGELAAWPPGWLRVGTRCAWSPRRRITRPGQSAPATAAVPTVPSSGRGTPERCPGCHATARGSTHHRRRQDYWRHWRLGCDGVPGRASGNRRRDRAIHQIMCTWPARNRQFRSAISTEGCEPVRI
jgi:hypothetical protein